MPKLAVTDITRIQTIANAARAFSIASNKHVGGGASSAELFAALYFSGVTTAGRHGGDRVVLSKGHAPGSYYFSLWLLDRFGETSLDELLAYGSPDSPISRMPQRNTARGIEMSTGALGQGLSFGNGLALADRKSGIDRETFVILGDGECTEGQIWEAAATSCSLKLANVTVLLDVNGFGSGITLDREQWEAKWRAFGFAVLRVDGHDVNAVVDALAWARGSRPTAVLLETVKGKGLSGTLANTNLVHNEVPGAERIRPDLPMLAAAARRCAVESPVDLGPVGAGAEAAAEDERRAAVERLVAAIPATERQVAKAHTKKFMKELAHVVEPGGRIVFVTPDALTNSALDPLVAEYGRCDWSNPDSPIVECFIAEQDAASLAAGLAAGGYKAVLMLMEGFVWRMLDSLRESILFQQLPVTVVATSGGLGDGLGPMVQSDSCFHAITGMFGLEVFEGSDINAAKVLFAEALRHPGPSYLRLPHEERPVLAGYAETASRPLRDGIWTLRDPADARITVLTAGSIVPNVLAAADELARLGHPARVLEVVAITRLRALGAPAVRELVEGRGALLTVHNGPSSVLGALPVTVNDALGADSYGRHGKPVDQLYILEGLGVTDIVARALKCIEAGSEH